MTGAGPARSSSPGNTWPDSAELDYAGNTHVGQGRTVDTAHLLVTGTLSRRSLYVGLTRGRESNTAHIATGKTAPPGHPPYEQASPESVVKAILDRDDADLSATEQIRHAQDWTGGTGHLLTLWSAAVKDSLYPQIDQQIKARLTETEAWRYQREHARPVLQHKLRAAQLAGHDISAVIDQITAAPLDGARSISSVLHGRLQRLQLPDLGHGATWAQRTPKDAPAVAHELAAGLDQRARALGDQLAASPEPWLASQLGVLAPHASPLLREDYARRAAAAAAYREAAGITDPGQAIAPEPHHGNPELDHLRRAAIRALEIRDETEITRRMTHGELEARILDGDRALASRPARRLPGPAAHRPRRSRRLAAIRRRRHPARPGRLGCGDGARPPPGRPAQTARSRERPLRKMGRRHQQQAEKQPGKPEPSWSGADSRRRQPNSGSPAPKGSRRPRWSGGGSSKPISPPSTGPSNASSRPPSPRANPGHPGMSPGPCAGRKTAPGPTRRPTASPARMTRPKGSTNYSPRPLRQPGVSLRKRLTGKPEPTTPLVSNEKPMPNPSPPRRPKPHTRQKSNCSHAMRAGLPGHVDAVVDRHARSPRTMPACRHRLGSRIVRDLGEPSYG